MTTCQNITNRPLYALWVGLRHLAVPRREEPRSALSAARLGRGTVPAVPGGKAGPMIAHCLMRRPRCSTVPAVAGVHEVAGDVGAGTARGACAVRTYDNGAGATAAPANRLDAGPVGALVRDALPAARSVIRPVCLTTLALWRDSGLATMADALAWATRERNAPVPCACAPTGAGGPAGSCGMERAELGPTCLYQPAAAPGRNAACGVADCPALEYTLWCGLWCDAITCCEDTGRLTSDTSVVCPRRLRLVAETTFAEVDGRARHDRHAERNVRGCPHRDGPARAPAALAASA